MIQERILKSSAVLFIKFGYERTSLKLIAQASGVAVTHIARLFYNKEEILRSSFLEALGRMTGKVAQAGSREHFSIRPAVLQLWKRLMEYEQGNKEEFTFVQRSLKSLQYYYHDNFRKELFMQLVPFSSFLATLEKGLSPFKALYILNCLLNPSIKTRPELTDNARKSDPGAYFEEYLWPDIDKVIRLPFQ